MQALLGLFLFSVLLTTGASLECETCSTNDCTNSQKQSCPADLDTCLTLVGEVTIGEETSTSTFKSCYSKKGCDLLKSGMSFTISGVPSTMGEVKIKEVTCNKAPSASASLLLALSGLLLLKMLFWCIS